MAVGWNPARFTVIRLWVRKVTGNRLIKYTSLGNLVSVKLEIKYVSHLTSTDTDNILTTQAALLLENGFNEPPFMTELIQS